MGALLRILLPALETAAKWLVPELINYLARKAVSKIKRKERQETDKKDDSNE